LILFAVLHRHWQFAVFFLHSGISVRNAYDTRPIMPDTTILNEATAQKNSSCPSAAARHVGESAKQALVPARSAAPSPW